MALTPEQSKVFARIVQIGRQVGASPKEIKAAVETGLVESNLRNLPGGDADSAGWRQERASIYPDPTNLDASIRRFFGETSAVKGKYGSAGSLAAAVQRPAAQYRGRYQQRSGEASALLGGTPTAPSSSPSAAPTSTRTTTTTTTPGVDNSAARASAIQQFLGTKGSDPLDFAMQIRGLQDTPGKTTSSVSASSGQPSATAPAGGSTAAKFISRANVLDRLNNAGKLPYTLGGGHAGRVNVFKAPIPVDCSGAVSAALGIDPRVSGDFERWGNPGEGGQITVYANSHHVLAKVMGRDGKYHFFATSHANPQGGAGWVPANQISPQYLQGFTARHI